VLISVAREAMAMANGAGARAAAIVDQPPIALASVPPVAHGFESHVLVLKLMCRGTGIQVVEAPNDATTAIFGQKIDTIRKSNK
jgi:hypothetical protein